MGEREENLTGRDRGDTIYMTVADGQGNVVSLIQSLFSDFDPESWPATQASSCTIAERSSTSSPGHPERRSRPHKRPLHTLIPAFVMKDGKPWLSFGVMGGDHQAQGHTQVLVNLIDFGMNIQEAGEAARVNHGVGRCDGRERRVPVRARRPDATRPPRLGSPRRAIGGFQGESWIDPRARRARWADRIRERDGLAIGF